MTVCAPSNLRRSAPAALRSPQCAFAVSRPIALSMSRRALASATSPSSMRSQCGPSRRTIQCDATCRPGSDARTACFRMAVNGAGLASDVLRPATRRRRARLGFACHQSAMRVSPRDKARDAETAGSGGASRVDHVPGAAGQVRREDFPRRWRRRDLLLARDLLPEFLRAARCAHREIAQARIVFFQDEGCRVFARRSFRRSPRGFPHTPSCRRTKARQSSMATRMLAESRTRSLV